MVVRSFAAAAPKAPSGDVVIPELVDTLEWVLDSPPTVHQFDEPPVSFISIYYFSPIYCILFSYLFFFPRRRTIHHFLHHPFPDYCRD